MGLALEDNSGGVVLFSTSRPERIKDVMEQPLPAQMLRAAREEIAKLLMPEGTGNDKIISPLRAASSGREPV